MQRAEAQYKPRPLESSKQLIDEEVNVAKEKHEQTKKKRAETQKRLDALEQKYMISFCEILKTLSQRIIRNFD